MEMALGPVTANGSDSTTVPPSSASTTTPAAPPTRPSYLTESLKLEHQFLRVPLEHFKKTIRTNHRIADREVNVVISTATAIADGPDDLSKEDAAKHLSSLVSRFQGLKRKLEEGSKAEELQAQRCRARLEHLEGGQAEDLTEWNNTRLKRILIDYMCRTKADTMASSPKSRPRSSSASCSPSSSTSSRQLLLDTASAISDGNLETAAANLTILKRAANPRGGPDQRLMAMMVSALLSRINPPSPGNSTIAELCSLEHQTATQMLYDASPCFKLGLMAANRAILEATRDHPKIHILDFDIGHGGQYADLIHALAERYRHRPQEPVSPAAPPHPQTSPNL